MSIFMNKCWRLTKHNLMKQVRLSRDEAMNARDSVFVFNCHSNDAFSLPIDILFEDPFNRSLLSVNENLLIGH